MKTIRKMNIAFTSFICTLESGKRIKPKIVTATRNIVLNVIIVAVTQSRRQASFAAPVILCIGDGLSM